MVHSKRVLATKTALAWLQRSEIDNLASVAKDLIYLGPLSETFGPSGCALPPKAEAFAVDLATLGVPEEKVLAAADGAALRSGRELLVSEASDDEVTVAGLALAMADWHQSARFEGRSGKATVPVEGGAKRQVEGGTAKVYPRTDPVAIGLILSPDGRRILLGRSHKYPAGMYTCLSGFIDSCESVEEAFRREAFEEAGVVLDSISLVASQPWPIGRGGSCELMRGCRAVAASEEVSVNKEEIDDARWFTRKEVQQMLQQKHPNGLWVPPRFAIANSLITEFATASRSLPPLGGAALPALAGAAALGLLVGLAVAKLRPRL